MGLFEKLQELMVTYHFRPEKKLSQFFCINDALLIYLTKVAEINEKDSVLEIGPGTGFLTKHLLKKAGKVVVIEKDSNMIELLENEFQKEIKEGKLEIIEKGFEDVNFDSLKVNKIVSLPPYHLSSQLIMQIALSNKIEEAVLVLDTGFIEKLTAFAGLKEYVALSAFLNLNSEIEIVQKVDKNSFFPAPNCLSAITKLDFDVVENSENFYLFLKQLFRHKNKDLSRALKQAIPFLKKGLKINKEKIENLDKIKNSDKKVYLMEPGELLETFEKILKINKK
jgi:16S rRNA (adenine1518-N6/adenine1519-N6)-dimethyltransferase